MAALTGARKAQFEADGYVMVPDLFDAADLGPIREEIQGVVAGTAERLFAEGAITDRHESEGFETRLTRLLADHPDRRADYLRALGGKGGGGHAGRAMFDLITHPKLLDAMESLVGPEVVGSSVYRIRPKVPRLDHGVVPWHQDSGYFAPHCDTDLIVTVWVPLVDATPENGCLQVLPGVHRDGILRHRTGGHAGYLVIQDGDLPRDAPEVVTVPVPLGGALLMTNLTPHRSTENHTDVIRWSVDLRYQSRSVPHNLDESPEEYDLTAETVTMACYPPEGDFLVRSRQRPEEVPSYEQFVERRARFESLRIPGPRRGWQPVGAD